MFSTIPNIISRAFPLNPDARAFIIAAGITDATTIFAINELVNSLQVNSLWTKMAAIYPFAGSTATTQKWNLKDPRDLDAAYRLTFVGGVTHSSSGMQPNGTNGYANTFFNPSTGISPTISASLGIYINLVGGGTIAYDMGIAADANVDMFDLVAKRTTGSVGIADFGTFPSGRVESAAQAAAGTGTTIGSIRSANDRAFFRNGLSIATSATNFAPAYANGNIPIGAYNITTGAFAGVGQFVNNRYAFAFIGTGLTDTEALTLTSLVQRYLNTLSRSVVAIPTVSDIDAQNFLVAAEITDNTQANAIQNLVAGLKSNSLWTKMQAIYPFVGSTSTTHKFNLKSPFDTNTAFRLTFSGGYTQNSNGITPNGTNAFANTFYNMNTSGSLNDSHISVYSRTNVQRTGGKDIAALSTSPTAQTYLELRDTANQSEVAINDGGSLASPGFTDSSGLFVGSRPDASNTFLYRNTTQKAFVKASTGKTTVNLYLSALNNNGTAQQFSTRNLAWASIGSSLSATDVSNLYTVVQAYQTALSRQV